MAENMSKTDPDFNPRILKHYSDCALHNEPAMPRGPCDCGLEDRLRAELERHQEVTLAAQILISSDACAATTSEEPDAMDTACDLWNRLVDAVNAASQERTK